MSSLVIPTVQCRSHRRTPGIALDIEVSGGAISGHGTRKTHDTIRVPSRSPIGVYRQIKTAGSDSGPAGSTDRATQYP